MIVGACFKGFYCMFPIVRCGIDGRCIISEEYRDHQRLVLSSEFRAVCTCIDRANNRNQKLTLKVLVSTVKSDHSTVPENKELFPSTSLDEYSQDFLCLY
jgi:hypothetical protein